MIMDIQLKTSNLEPKLILEEHSTMRQVSLELDLYLYTIL